MPNAKYLLTEIDLSEYGLGTIYPLKVSEVIKLDELKLTEYLYPFLIELNKEEFSDLKLFDCLFMQDEQMNNLLLKLIFILKILYKVEDIQFNADSNGIYISISNAIINHNNYNKLCEIVRGMFFFNPKEDEKRVIVVAEQNKAILEEYLRLEKQHEAEMAELNKNKVKTLHQIVTIVASQCLWDYDKVLSMTYYRLINTYVSIFKIDSYTTFMQYATSGQFDMKNQSQEHWTEIVGN